MAKGAGVGSSIWQAITCNQCSCRSGGKAMRGKATTIWRGGEGDQEEEEVVELWGSKKNLWLPRMTKAQYRVLTWSAALFAAGLFAAVIAAYSTMSRTRMADTTGCEVPELCEGAVSEHAVTDPSPSGNLCVHGSDSLLCGPPGSVFRCPHRPTVVSLLPRSPGPDGACFC